MDETVGNVRQEDEGNQSVAGTETAHPGVPITGSAGWPPNSFLAGAAGLAGHRIAHLEAPSIWFPTRQLSAESVLQLGAALLELTGAIIAGGFDLLFDADNLPVDGVIFIKQSAEMGVRRFQVMDRLPELWEFDDEGMMKIGSL